MNLSNSTSERIFLHIPPLKWRNFRQSMLNARQKREEVIGFLFCQRQQLSKKIVRYIPKAWVVPTPDCYEHQSNNGLELKQQFHQYILDTYLRDRSLHVVHVHTHFGDEAPTFSYIDDRHEAEYARFLSFCYRKRPRLISGVFNESLDKCKFRLWNRQGTYHAPIEFYNSWFAPSEDSLTEKNPVPMFERQKVFGNLAQQKLSQLKVALIGCGGIGSVFAEQLGRLGVKNWILIDPDRLETVNLNRMPAANQKMVEQGWYKVNYVKWLLKRIYEVGSNIHTVNTSIENTEASRMAAQADLIVVATDNHLSRKLAQELALKYDRPLISMGTHIDIDESHRPKLYARVTLPPIGGDWCLMCGNVIDLRQASLESTPSSILKIAEDAGYVPAIADPAVYWLNSICASAGVGIVHSMVSDFLDLDSGIDWIYDFANANWLKTDTTHLHSKNCYFCSPNSDHLADEKISIHPTQLMAG